MTIVILERFFLRSISATAKDSILYPLPENSPTTLDKTLASLSTHTTIMCVSIFPNLLGVLYAYSTPSKLGKIDTHIIVVWVDNEASVLSRVVGLFSGRGYNIESLAVAEIDRKKNLSRITIVTTGTPQVIEQIVLQLKKLVPVHNVANFKREDQKVIFKEMALLKIVANSIKIKKALNACKKYNPVILDQTNKSAVIQITALRREIDNMIKNLKPLGLVSASRTGAVAMTRGAGILN